MPRCPYVVCYSREDNSDDQPTFGPFATVEEAAAFAVKMRQSCINLWNRVQGSDWYGVPEGSTVEVVARERIAYFHFNPRGYNLDETYVVINEIRNPDDFNPEDLEMEGSAA